MWGVENIRRADEIIITVRPLSYILVRRLESKLHYIIGWYWETINTSIALRIRLYLYLIYFDSDVTRILLNA